MPRRGWTPAARRINGRRLERNRKFVDSPLEEDGFELAVPPQRERLWAAATPGVIQHRNGTPSKFKLTR